ncbi:uncharacterized protein EV154DRAFT_502575 [Mucor mucedo]|uniref:uncharacterized protein n=1 Tax=Mucor mucedo TaxID=29922 RepID=UPI00221F4535|nr:uncharacterized protein EV154DRAFT_502575 [Mucor mucedo]KAI7893134.1 hypothetical protein EV154DRAFT_502575 [Mucor mucedo]
MSSMNETGASTPPALPDRSRSVGELTVNKQPIQKSHTAPSTGDSSMDEHYSHLHKHVKEVRRRKKTDLSSPKLSEFQEKKGDTVISTKWVEFLEAWIKYFVASAAYDKIDRPLEPLSLNQVKHDLDRLYPMVAPFIGPAKKIRSVYRWENKPLTAGLASLYVILWWYDLILAFVCTWLAIGIAWVRLDTFAQYGIDALEEQPETDATVKSWDRGFWMKMRTTVAKNSQYKPFDLFNDLNISEWRNSIYTEYGPTIQLVLSDTVDYLERIKNLVTWKRPAKTRFLLIMVIGSSFFLTILPFKLIGKMVFLHIGIEFFVLQALRSYYPRHRRLFNILNLLLWDVPNDAEYALEVVRLNGPLRKPKTETTTQGPPRPTPQKFSVSMSDIPTSSVTTVDKGYKTPEKSSSGIQDAATSAATTLGMLVAAAAVNKVKKTIDNKKKKKLEIQNEIPADEDNDAFGCLYRGTIPGRIGIQENGFIFQTSRMTGSNVIVECAYTDIVGVKKTKQYDMLVWHSNGVDISLADGTTLHFENVLRRDECFNRLLSASGDEGGEWKKM